LPKQTTCDAGPASETVSPSTLTDRLTFLGDKLLVWLQKSKVFFRGESMAVIYLRNWNECLDERHFDVFINRRRCYSGSDQLAGLFRCFFCFFAKSNVKRYIETPACPSIKMAPLDETKHFFQAQCWA
jgi:hypothetical protein